jgi:serine protease Do
MIRFSPSSVTRRGRALAVSIASAASLVVPLAAAGLPGAAAAQTVAAAAVPATGVASVRGLPDFTDLVELVGPAVVNIRASQKVKAPPAGARLDPNIEEFLRRFGIPVPRPNDKNGPQPPDDEDDDEEHVVGSGFILSADGLVMTNAHVVNGADEVIVTLTDKREFKAKIVGADTRSDVAVVRIEAKALPFVKIGDVNRLKVGEWVIAIGSPFNLENTVTAGIVSAKQRDTGELLKLLQTDVAINPGNSGGPLINMRGEVVGINSQILSRSGGYAGISLAIPIDEAIHVADQLRTEGRVVRGRIGVQIGPVSKEIGESLGLRGAVGAMVNVVQPGLPAEIAGIQPGDVITSVNGQAVEHSSDLPRLVAAVHPGQKATLQVFHNGKARNVTVSVVDFVDDAAADDKEDTPTTPPSKGKPVPKPVLGMTLSDLSDAKRLELKIKGGVRVDAVEGPAARAGVQEGDILLAIALTDVTSVSQVMALMPKLEKGKPVNVLVRRGDQVNWLLIRPAK